LFERSDYLQKDLKALFQYKKVQFSLIKGLLLLH
jgi:hypothetical protein